MNHRPPHALYLHGFASGPGSRKATLLCEALAGLVASFSVPRLDGGDFTGMTMETLCAQAMLAIEALPGDGAGVLVIGSSLGGYLAAWAAGRGLLPRASALLLLAPAFGFTRRWRQILGAAEVDRWRREGVRLFHHDGEGRDLPLGSSFLASCERLPDLAAPAPVPTVVLHGTRDESVDHRCSQAWVALSPLAELHLLDCDHALDTAEAKTVMTIQARRLAEVA